MTQAVENTDSYYVANGATTSFSFSFSAFTSSEVIVLADGVTATGYTFSESFPISGGANVVFSSAPATDVVISILRNTALTQEANFDSTTTFLEADHEKALDKVVRAQQDLARDVREKSVRIGDADEGLEDGFIIPKPVSGDEGKLVSINDTLDGFDLFENTIGDISDAVAAAQAAQAAAETAETNAETAETNAETAATTATTQAGIATTQAGLASNSAGEASAIANGSLNTFTLLPDGTWSPTVAGEARQITGTTTINLPAPAANFWIKFDNVGNNTITVNRDDTEDFFVKDETISNNLIISEYGFYTIACINGTDWQVTRSNTTDVYVSAPAGATAADTLTGTTLASGVTASSLTSVGTLSSLAMGGTIDCNNQNIQEVKSATFNGEVDNGNSSTADTIDWGAGNKQRSTLTDNCTFTFTAPAGVTNVILKLIQDGTGSRTVTWPSSTTVKWAGGTAPTLSTAAGAIDIVSFYFDGTNYFGQAGLAFA